LLLVACFGNGPLPGKPSEATLVFAAPAPTDSTRCTNSVYIGDVAFAGGTGYTLTPIYVPSDCCSSGGCPEPSLSLDLTTFEESGALPAGMSVTGDPAGQVGPFGAVQPHVATNGASVAWVYTPDGSMQLAIGPGQTRFSSVGGSPVGLFAPGGMTLYLAIANASGGGMTGGYIDPASPEFPCCTPSPSVASANDAIVQASLGNGMPTVLASNLSLYYDEMVDGLVGNASHAYFVTRGDVAMGTAAQIRSLTLAGNAIATVHTITFAETNSAGATQCPSSPGCPVPVGIATDTADAHVAWVVANRASSMNNAPPVSPGCWVFVQDVATADVHVFASERFSCMGAAIDDTHLYFTIVHSEVEDCGGGCTAPLHGDGIGRITLDGQTFESIALGMHGFAAGPRRVYLDGDSLYAVDPLAIGKIAKTALDGKRDIEP
jgi:hypothetical protein